MVGKNNLKPNHTLRTSTGKVDTIQFISYRVKFCAGKSVKITDTSLNESITIPYDFRFNNINEIAFDYLTSQGLEIAGFTWDEKGKFYNILTTDQNWTLSSC